MSSITGGNFDLVVNTAGAVVTLSPSGSLVEEAGNSISRAVEENLNKGILRFIFDMKNIISVSSPALAMLLDLVETIVDGKGGRVVFLGLSDLNYKVFEMVGMFLYAEACSSDREAEVQVLL